jgi:nucleoid-associated protein YgaU
VGSQGPTTAIRSTARPRNTAPVDRPVYKVRRYDTLRSIARDVLGDPRRADELYDLNRDVIDDPTRLTAGQLLQLPEDADPRRVTVQDRYRGRD